MRSVCFVKRLQWDLPGTVVRHGLTIGDVDNDGENELVVGTTEGELYIFKGSELWQKIKGLGSVTCVAIGDIFNYGRNALVVICGDGWAHIYYSPRSVNPSTSTSTTTGSSNVINKKPGNQDNVKINTGQFNADTLNINVTNPTGLDQIDNASESSEMSGKMECVHVQRIPTNTKVVLIADVDEDNANEMVIGLTDRVVRSYRWSSNIDLGTGKLVGLNKWESAQQIGTVTLQHTSSGTPLLLVAQPGGTFMRIKCHRDDGSLEDSLDTNSEIAASYVDYQSVGISRMRNPNISTEILGDLEPGPNDFNLDKGSSKNIAEKDWKDLTSSETEQTVDEKKMHGSIDHVDGNLLGGNVILGETESWTDKKSVFPSYEDFNPSNEEAANNDNNNDVKIGQAKDNDSGNFIEDSCISNSKPYALATLDGTIILMKGETVLWAMQVDHQIFALCRLDVNQDGADEIIACAWDGQTYILDQQRNRVRFQFEEPVRAFCTGMYNVTPGASTTCFVYNTFNNKIYLYYDVMLPSMVLHNLDPREKLNPVEKDVLDKVLDSADNEKDQRLKKLTEWLLYGVE